MEKELLYGGISFILTLGFYGGYLWSLFKGETKPHVYTAMLYTIITGIILFSQYESNAGWGMVYLAVTTVFWLIIFLLSFKYGIKDISKGDRRALVLALCAIPLWYVSGTPLYSVILLIVADIFSAYPTYRKTYYHPDSENKYVYFIEVIAISSSILALSKINFINSVYLFYIIFMDILLIIIIFYRRRQLNIS